MEPLEDHHLLNGDLLGGGGGSLGNKDGQDAVLQAGLDSILVDASGEGEGALELADAALAGPVAVLLLGLGSGGFGFSLFAAVLGLGFGGGVLALGATLHDEGLGVGELNIDVLLRDARQLSIQVVGISALAHVEAGREGAESGRLAAGAVVVVVVEQAEQRGEVARAGKVGAEERHGDWVGCQMKQVIVEVVVDEVWKLVSLGDDERGEGKKGDVGGGFYRRGSSRQLPPMSVSQSIVYWKVLD